MQKIEIINIDKYSIVYSPKLLFLIKKSRYLIDNQSFLMHRLNE